MHSGRMPSLTPAIADQVNENKVQLRPWPSSSCLCKVHFGQQGRGTEVLERARWHGGSTPRPACSLLRMVFAVSSLLRPSDGAADSTQWRSMKKKEDQQPVNTAFDSLIFVRHQKENMGSVGLGWKKNHARGPPCRRCRGGAMSLVLLVGARGGQHQVKHVVFGASGADFWPITTSLVQAGANIRPNTMSLVRAGPISQRRWCRRCRVGPTLGRFLRCRAGIRPVHTGAMGGI